MSAKKSLATCSAHGVAIAVLEQRVNDLAALSGDVKSILDSINEVKLSLAKLPTWEHINKIQDDVTSLKALKNRAEGSWKTIVTISSVASCIVGIAMWVVERLLK